MTTGRWEKVQEIFGAASEMAQPARQGYVARASNNDTRMMEEVASLLEAFESAGNFIDVVDRADSAFRQGMSLGPYRIVQVIGEGGMGRVYQAVRVDDLYRKLVALKVIRRGFDSDIAIRKFETERHILAHLEHPNIARLLDGGTTEDGAPYFVMDFIAGTPVDEYCSREELCLRERLKMFLTVCGAVQYAHENFVVHRDIKPQNILVTAEGSIRLLDFGIAKLLDPEAQDPARTIGAVQMTPEYASPEQLFNEPITAASDIYSLGVLLYVMLTGQHPFALRSRSLIEICDAIRDCEPRRPSWFVKELRGDLDAILLTALRREVRRRYLTVAEMALDIERFLAGLPVSARKSTFAYRSTRFVQRHKGGVLAAAFALLALIEHRRAQRMKHHN